MNIIIGILFILFGSVTAWAQPAPITIQGPPAGQNLLVTIVGPSSTPTPTPTPPNCVTILSPLAGATLSNPAILTAKLNNRPSADWVNWFLDNKYIGTGFSYSWNTTGVTPGTHNLTAGDYYTSNIPPFCSQSISVNISSASYPSIPGLTGSGTMIPGADTNVANYGKYTASGGTGPNNIGLIGGPLLDDVTASKYIVPTQKSTVETGSNGAANALANNYFANVAVNNPTDYMNQLNGFWAGYGTTGWGRVWGRIDGACAMVAPTTAMVGQWAANKWGINPILMYAEATLEGDWDQTALGDWSDGVGGSSGVWQVADRNTASRPNHAFPGFVGSGSMLSRENTCFNADFYAGHIYAAFHGWSNEGATGADIGASIQSWLVGTVSGPGNYTTLVYNQIIAKDWINRFFNGVDVPY